MSEKGKHLLFYDGECGLCDEVVQFLIKYDKNQIFDFAPLQGKTAKQWLNFPLEEDTVVLIENYKTHPQKYILSSAVFRSLLLLKGLWVIPGVLFYFPSLLFNGFYRLVARNRHHFFRNQACVVPDPNNKSRYLD